jgi:hypothetical protein
MTRMTRHILTISLLLLGLWLYDTMRPVPQPPGVLAPDAPRIEAVTGKPQIFERNAHVLTALARFDAHARVLSLDRYAGDRAAKVAPLDIALGWGPMSDSVTLKIVDVAQTKRGVLFKSYDPKLPDEQAATFLLNVHVIAADAELAKKLEDVRAGNIVRMQGWLVEAVAGDGWRWRGEQRRDAPALPGTLLWLTQLEVS